MIKNKKVLVSIFALICLSLASFGGYYYFSISQDGNEGDDTILKAAATKASESKITDKDQKEKTVYVVDTGETYDVAYYNVVDDFQAVGDGKTDCTKAFNAAFAAAESCTSNNGCGNLVYVPPGKYVLKGNINIKSYTGLIGAGPDNTVLMIYNSSDHAISLQAQSSIRGVAIYYPEQKITNGTVKTYPATIVNEKGNAEIDNVNFVNSYIAMDFTRAGNNSIIFINNVKGTPLKTGLVNDGNLDTIRISNLNFGADHWNKYDNTNINSIKSVLKNQNLKSTALEFRRVDWSFLANIDIKDYYRGIYLTDSPKLKTEQPDYKTPEKGKDQPRIARDTEGEIFDSRITNCTYPIDISNSRHYVITSSKLESSGGIGLNIQNVKNGDNGHDALDTLTNYSVYDTTITSSGSNSIYYGGHGTLAVTGSTIDGKITKLHDDSKLSVTGSNLSNTTMDGCNATSSQSITYTKPTDYAKKVTTKPSKTKVIAVGVGKSGKDITTDLKNAIAKLKDGGIIYIPTGIYTVSKEVKVTKGIEIVGATPWAHNGSLTYSVQGRNSVYQLRSSRINLTGNAVFTLVGDSGLNGLEIITSNTKKYAIEGNGDNIYVRNVSLPGVTNGIKITGNKFLVEHIWGAVQTEGINVNGNNGIIRECHITKNARLNAKDDTTEKLYIQNKTYIVKGSNNIVYHDFTFGPNTGFVFDNATNIKAIGIGVDSSSTGVSMQTSSGKIVNALIVSNHKQTADNYYFHGTKSKSSTSIEIVNPILWSGDQGTSSVFRGSGELRWLGGIYERYEKSAIATESPKLVMAGVTYKNEAKTEKVLLLSGVKNAYLSGVINICPDANCNNEVNNVAKAKLEVKNPVTSCPATKQTQTQTPTQNQQKQTQTPTQNQQKQTQTPTQKQPTNGSSSVGGISIDKTPAYGWSNLNLSNTTINNKSATTKVCGLGKTYTYFVYSTAKDKEKSVKISNGCATIKITAGTYQYLKYKLKGTKSETETRTVQNVCKYLIFAQVYNKFLYAGKSASNNSANLGGWVGKSAAVSTSVRSIATVAINNTKSKSNTEFVKMLYRGILGREYDKGGLKTWENFLKKNSRNELLKRFVDSTEARNIYASWGYK